MEIAFTNLPLFGGLVDVQAYIVAVSTRLVGIEQSNLN